MALTQTAEYALRAVIWLAQNPGSPQTTSRIADATHVPASYLPKVLQPLVRAGLLNGQRGIGGGYTLTRDPHEVTLLEVVDHVDPIQRIESCPLSLKSHGARLCPLHSLLNQIIGAEAKRLEETTVGSLLGREGAPTPLCEVAELLREAKRDAAASKRAAASPTVASPTAPLGRPKTASGDDPSNTGAS